MHISAVFAGLLTFSPLFAAADELERHVDRESGFAMTYDGSFWPIEPNEAVTKLLLLSDGGNRCWVTVVPNPLITTPEFARALVALLTTNLDRFRDQYLTIFKEVSEISSQAVVVSPEQAQPTRTARFFPSCIRSVDWRRRLY